MFIKIDKTISKKQSSGFAQVPIQAALICEEAKKVLTALLKREPVGVGYVFKQGKLILSCPRLAIPEISTYTAQIQETLDTRVGAGKVREIQLRAI